MVRHGRRHRNPEEYQARLQVYRDNQQRVQQLNGRDNASHRWGSLPMILARFLESPSVHLCLLCTPMLHTTHMHMWQRAGSVWIMCERRHGLGIIDIKARACPEVPLWPHRAGHAQIQT